MDRDPEEEERVEALLRVNAELAAEVRSLRGGVDTRSASVPAARQVARVLGDLESARAQLASGAAELESAHIELAAREEETAQLKQQVEELLREVNRLRSGMPGFLRRTRARLLKT